MMGEAAVPRLEEELLSDGESRNPVLAAWALAEIGGDQAKPALELAVTSDRDEQLKKEFQRALTDLRTRSIGSTPRTKQRWDGDGVSPAECSPIYAAGSRVAAEPGREG